MFAESLVVEMVYAKYLSYLTRQRRGGHANVLFAQQLFSIYKIVSILQYSESMRPRLTVCKRVLTMLGFVSVGSRSELKDGSVGRWTASMFESWIVLLECWLENGSGAMSCSGEYKKSEA